MNLTRAKSPRVLAGLMGTAMILAVGLAPGSAIADDKGSEAGRQVAAAKAQAKARGKSLDPATTRTRHQRLKAEPSGTTVGLVVGFKSGVSATASAQSLSAVGLRAAAANPLAALRAHRVTVARADSAKVAAELRADPAVAFVETDGVAHATEVTPNDPLYADQSELRQITVPAAWDRTTGSAVTVAVIDTGVTSIGDVTGAVLAGRDFVNNDNDPVDDEGHGTAVASLIAGRGNNGVGMAGVCWQCRILPVKVLNSAGSGSYSNIAAGIVYAADRGAKIINISLGGYSTGVILQNAVNYAVGKGAALYASAGNDLLSDRLYPAAYAGVTAVGGTGDDGERYIDCWIVCTGSNWGSDWVDIAAPFCSVALNLAGFANDTGGAGDQSDNYTTFCGTSGSAPLVSGVAALVKSNNPNANAWSLNNSLTSTAVLRVYKSFFRYGEIRADRAVVTVDGTAPRVTGATPANNTRFRGIVTLGATGVSDTGGSGLSRGALYVDGKYAGQDYSAPFSVKYNSGRRNGTVRFQWRVYDRAGNSAVYNRSLIADNTGPKVAVTSAPKNGAKVKGTVTVKASASDPSGVNRVELLINGKVVARDYKAGYAFKIKVSKYGKKIKMQVRSYDRVGNAAVTPARTWKH